MDWLRERMQGCILKLPVSKNARSVEEIHRKLRGIAAVLLDPAATDHEKANAEALKIRLEKRLEWEAITEGRWAIVPYERMPPPALWRPGHPRSDLIKVLIASAISVSLAGYFFFEGSHQHSDVQPQPTIDTPRVAFLALPQGTPASVGPTGIPVESIAESEVQLQSALRSDINRAEREIEAMPTSNSAHQTSPEHTANAVLDAPNNNPIIEQRQSLARSVQASTCLPSASAVRQDHPGAWPSWTLRALGHEGSKCWHPANRVATRNNRSGVPGGSNGVTVPLPGSSTANQRWPQPVPIIF